MNEGTNDYRKSGYGKQKDSVICERGELYMKMRFLDVRYPPFVL